MKLLSLLISLMLGAAVLLVFIRPWGALQPTIEGARKTPPAVPANHAPLDPAAEDGTARVDAGVKPAEATAKPPPEVGEPQEPKPEQPKTHLLAREQADAERSAALKDKTHATKPTPPETKRYFQVKVRDAGTLEVDLPAAKTLVIRLAGIDSREADETCNRENGTKWPCGAKSRAALIRLIRYRAVTCTLPPGGETDDFAARCSLMGQDLSVWLVRRGWATPKHDAEPALGEALAAAKTEGVGLWARD